MAHAHAPRRHVGGTPTLGARKRKGEHIRASPQTLHPSNFLFLSYADPFPGSIGAARDLAALKAAGITHVLNASPAVPCFHQGALTYQRVRREN
jgi:hypothetical protein